MLLPGAGDLPVEPWSTIKNHALEYRLSVHSHPRTSLGNSSDRTNEQVRKKREVVQKEYTKQHMEVLRRTCSPGEAENKARSKRLGKNRIHLSGRKTESLTSIHPLGSRTLRKARLYSWALSSTQWGSRSLTRKGVLNQNKYLVRCTR